MDDYTDALEQMYAYYDEYTEMMVEEDETEEDDDDTEGD